MERKREIAGVYEELRGVLVAIKDNTSWFDDDGFSQHANRVIARVASLCPEIQEIDSYKIKVEYDAQRGAIVKSIPARAGLNSLIGRLKGQYDLEVATTNTGHTFIQNQQMNVELMLDVRGQIEKHLQDYTDEQPEKKFLEKVKANVSTAKSAMDVLRLIISTAKELGVSLAFLIKIFGGS